VKVDSIKSVTIAPKNTIVPADSIKVQTSDKKEDGYYFDVKKPGKGRKKDK
jgi:hypothetical protein